MIRKAVIVALGMLAMGTCLAWIVRPDSLELVPLQETEAGRLESHWVLFLHPGGLTIDYGPYTWLTPPRKFFSPGFAGFGYAHHRTTNQEYRSFKIPYWALFVLFATHPAIAFIRGPVRRWQRRRRGLCLTCAYDLTGNESGVCSECGAGIKADV